MPDIWFISDTHFGHANILTFKRTDGSPLRAFNTIEEHDETIVANWNRVVKPQDKIYHLGDICLHKRYLPILARCNGHKRLIRGNHDIDDTKNYLEYFEEIYGVRVFHKEGFICSHIPLHPESVARWKVNVHGHLHSNTLADKKYLNISCEQIDYTPIHIDTIKKYTNDS